MDVQKAEFVSEAAAVSPVLVSVDHIHARLDVAVRDAELRAAPPADGRVVRLEHAMRHALPRRKRRAATYMMNQGRVASLFSKNSSDSQSRPIGAHDRGTPPGNLRAHVGALGGRGKSFMKEARLGWRLTQGTLSCFSRARVRDPRSLRSPCDASVSSSSLKLSTLRGTTVVGTLASPCQVIESRNGRGLPSIRGDATCNLS